MKKIFFSMLYSRLVGEEPTRYCKKKEWKQNQDLTTISEGTGATFLFHFHSRVPMQRWTPVERLIHSDRHEGPTPLHCQNPCCIFEAVDLLASLMVQPSSRGAPFFLGPQRQNVGLVPTVHHGRKDSPSRDH
ncbi:hypothetical protein IEQ34_005395 [Dendrobium chrysotoxum]|uniref:Uncharacterized protein n=1 Tax=Dendrobium chrysotoxum TaxID=161865 RepID=A0AAV7HA07_DENCH|nr:hypothetical protein IEQ34_026252 [Dendrobium chrysotoxum]KAH0437233.1 hypothetical protein IEQ34_026284 [Dendrobium chrysotoxum]KAH0465292.1 hypothetical protein IEQ34_005395 [Dendrobium chrysotoxum]